MPAQCRTCGHIAWAQSLLSVEGPGSLTFQAQDIVYANACEECGGDMYLFEGPMEISAEQPFPRLARRGWAILKQLQTDVLRIIEAPSGNPTADLAASNRELAAAVDRVVDVLHDANPRTTRKTLAVKVLKYVAATLFAAVVTVGENVVADEITNDEPSEQPADPPSEKPSEKPVRVQIELFRRLEEIHRARKIPPTPRPPDLPDTPRR